MVDIMFLKTVLFAPFSRRVGVFLFEWTITK